MKRPMEWIIRLARDLDTGVLFRNGQRIPGLVYETKEPLVENCRRWVVGGLLMGLLILLMALR